MIGAKMLTSILIPGGWPEWGWPGAFLCAVLHVLPVSASVSSHPPKTVGIVQRCECECVYVAL